MPGYYSVARHISSFVASVTQKGTTYEISANAASHQASEALPEVSAPRVIVFRHHFGGAKGTADGCSWTWPDEGVYIGTVYTQFTDWVQNHNVVDWPNYMSDGKTGNVVYDTPYFYVSVNALSMQAGYVENGAVRATSGTVTALIIPKRPYLEANQGVTATLSNSLATISDPVNDATNGYTYTITANDKNWEGQLYLQVHLDGTDYTRPVDEKILLKVNKTANVGQEVQEEGEVEIGVKTPLRLKRANQAIDSEDSKPQTNMSYGNNIKFVFFYFTPYYVNLNGVDPADYDKYEVVIEVPADVTFQNFSVEKQGGIWQMYYNPNLPTAQQSNKLSIPLDEFLKIAYMTSELDADGNKPDPRTKIEKLLMVRGSNGNGQIGNDFYVYLTISEKE